MSGVTFSLPRTPLWRTRDNFTCTLPLIASIIRGTYMQRVDKLQFKTLSVVIKCIINITVPLIYCVFKGRAGFS